MPRYLTATQAAAALEITVPTLYAYVSRGLVRSEVVGEKSRKRRYYAEDVDKLVLKKQAPEKMLESALDWGAPVLESAITLILDSKLYYRGRDASVLAVENTLEEVAALIWLNEMSAAADLFNFREPAPAEEQARALMELLQRNTALKELQIIQMVLQLAAVEDLAAYDLRPPAVIQAGARIVQFMTAMTAAQEGGSIAERLQRRWCPDHPQAIPLLNAALILCADHELNASSFTARVVASAGATPYGAVIGGLAALQGIRHVGHTERVEALLYEIGEPRQARTVIANWVRRGEMLPGFGHRLYPDGDPRAKTLLDVIRQHYPETRGVQLAETVAYEVQKVTGEPPNIDFALGSTALVIGLPPGKAMLLFALGRTVGWIGQMVEQVTDGRLIRPRARYIGEQPIK